MLGYTPDSSENVEVMVSSSNDAGGIERKQKYYGVKIQDLMEAGYLCPGMRLTSVYKSWPAEATLSTVGMVSINDTLYKSPSTAAQIIREGKATNGWDFWAVE